MSLWGQIMLQDANSPIMEYMLMFYDIAMMVIMMIVAMIMYMLIFMLRNKFSNRNLLDGQMIEIIWTIMPIFFLIFLAIPSLHILYMTDEINNPLYSIKVIGHQWYWVYEYGDFSIIIESYMISKGVEELFRLLDVDNRLILPVLTSIRFLVTSDDVIHSFAMPSLGMKVDAVPGRLNQVCSFIYRPGLYYGQCSEICGVNHSFMPIVIEATSMKNFFFWVYNNLS